MPKDQEPAAPPLPGALVASPGRAAGLRRARADFWEQFLSGLKPETRRAYEGDVKQFFAFLGATPQDYAAVAAIGPSDVAAFRDAVSAHDDAGRVKNAATVARKLSAVRQILKWYRACGVTDKSPSDLVKSPRVSRQSPRVGLTKEEARAIVDAVDPGTPTTDDAERVRRLRDRAIVELMLRTGIRREEVVLLRRRDLMRDRALVVVFVRGKGEKNRTLPLRPEVQTAIADYLAAAGRNRGEPDDPLFTPTVNRRTGVLDKRLFKGTVYQIVARAVRRAVEAGTVRAELAELITPHSLRHTAITFALDGGAKLERVQVMAGHADPATTMRYFRSADDLRQSAVNAIDF